MEFAETITVTNLIYLVGLILFAFWLLKTSLGRKALADSVPRRNNMPAYLPFVPLFICFGTISLTVSIINRLFDDYEFLDCAMQQVGNARININDEKPCVLFVRWQNIIGLSK